jgi:hypothetical protein
VSERASEEDNEFLAIGLVTTEVGVAEARKTITSLIADVAASGRTVRIRNERNASASSALLMSETTLSRLIERERQPSRTMGELLETLPHVRVTVPRLQVDAPDDTVPELRMPKVAAPRDAVAGSPAAAA